MARRIGFAAVVAIPALALATSCGKKPDFAAAQAKAQITGQKGTEFLRSQQLKDGTWSETDQAKVGLTALATIALMDQNADAKDPNIQRAAAFLAAQQKDDGSIRLQVALENYETALASLALKKTGNKLYDEAMKKAAAYLASIQRGADGTTTPASLYYGGIGYGRRGNPDLSNTQFALEALKESELGADKETFKRAIIFIERCQNLKRNNNQPWATDDGGFVYNPGGFTHVNPKAEYAPGEYRHSYGSMTYSGLLSFSYCDVPKDDPRVKAALDWLRAHYTVDENPGMGKKGLYYYYLVMAKALSAYGDKIIVDKEGHKHFWAVDLVNKMYELQQPDGSWVNTEA
ncbi:terpene cyclase/mutase family protein, partial [Candidatus Sumerlaeota bacterium]|nr:terpene cyclase/mutase family protein [Candidatus Sumerlaeota bacterium]